MALVAMDLAKCLMILDGQLSIKIYLYDVHLLIPFQLTALLLRDLIWSHIVCGIQKCLVQGTLMLSDTMQAGLMAKSIPDVFTATASMLFGAGSYLI